MIDTLKKLQELAVRGVDGERENAARKLKQLMDKYGISPEAIISEEIIECRYKYSSKWEKQLLFQVMAMVTDGASGYWQAKYTRNVMFKLTRSEKIEFEFLFESYKKDYRKKLKEQVDNFFSAFVHANRIFPSTPSSDSEKKNLSLEELDRLIKILNMAESIDKTQINRLVLQA